MSKLRFIIADDHSMVRQGVKGVIARQRSWEFCGEADNGLAAVELAKRVKPDIAVLDITMPGLNGLDAVRILREELPRTKLLILTMHDSEALADEIMRAGAHGYLLKSDAADQLPLAIAALRADKKFLTTGIVWPSPPADASETVLPDDSVSTRFRLTHRERQIAQLLAEGKTTKEIAEALDISRATVETHRKNIISKLKIRCAADLVRYAIRNNLIQV
jgi:DNA-binding NarL/FixJ family response regulator